MLNWQQVVTVTVQQDDGTTFDLGTMRGAEGGGKTAAGQYVRPGGMAPGVAMVEQSTFGEVTLRRFVQHNVDSGLIHKLMDFVGNRITAVQQPIDPKGNTGFHRPLTAGGLITGAVPPPYDVGGNDPQVIEITVQPDSMT